jgi:NifU-like protein involved in Fe-S cluster formation
VSAPLYNQDILRLAAQSASFERLSDPQATIEKRSPVCGSRIVVDVRIDDDARVSAVGGQVRACALGQASSALMAAHVVGLSADEIEVARDALGAFLDGKRDDPGDWPGLHIFAPARPHSARHASIRLAFEAVADAARAAAS